MRSGSVIDRRREGDGERAENGVIGQRGKE